MRINKAAVNGEHNQSSHFAIIAMIALAIQNISQALLVEVSKKSDEHSQYSSANVVLVNEFVKILMSLTALLLSGKSFNEIFRTLNSVPYRTSIKLAVPAFTYTIQNNLVFLSLQHIPSATYQVFSQLKVLTSAVFTVTLLRRRLHRVQWIALIILICGVTLANRPHTCDTQDKDVSHQERNPIIGITAVCCLTILSGFAGVYQERVVKTSFALPIHYLNLLLCAWSLLTNGASVIYENGNDLWNKGFFHGFTWLTWLIVFMQSSGGILVSIVIRYASNLAKSYVVAVAIFGTAFISWIFFDFEPNLEFGLGVISVTCSILLYNEPVRWAKESLSAK